MPNVVIAISTTNVSESRQIVSGRLYMDDDPTVLAHPELFDGDLEKYAVGYVVPAIEETTANPGEVRRTASKKRETIGA